MPEPRLPNGLGLDESERAGLDARVVRYLERRSGEGLSVLSLQPLAGDASTRRYYRVGLREGTGAASRVLALLPEAFDPTQEPYLNVARLFTEIPVRVPMIYDVAGSEGILLLEDCGDELLQTRVQRAVPATRRDLYLRALRILSRLQSRGTELATTEYVPYRLAFDEQKLGWELRYFLQHFLEGFLDVSIEASERDALHEAFATLAGEIAARPRVLCHRDYHSRNLMVLGSELVVLDFQDARMGPVSYDLVSLLRDSYVVLEDDFVEEMKAHFVRLSSHVSLESLEDEFDLVALQRNLKALGTFGYQCSVRSKSVYQRYIPGTLNLVRNNLSRKPRWDGLRRILSHHVPELA